MPSPSECELDMFDLLLSSKRMFQIENLTQDSISFLENIKDDDMQSKERVSKNMFFSISSGESRWPLLLFNIFIKKNLENHAKTCFTLLY